MKNLFIRMIVASLCLISTAAFSFPRLNSFPQATATLYLDVDGHLVTGSLWNNGNPIACAAPSLTDDQITEIFHRVAEDYRPFNINVTTDSLVFLAAPLTQRIRVIITPTSAWKPGVGGVAYIGSFTWGDDTPAFVFSDRLGPNNAKYIAECISHESGHTVGLSHQSRYDNACTLTETYHSGVGSGETGWAPIMGNGYSRNMTGWNDGPTPYGCSTTQDNLSIITGTNGFSYRTDDYSDSLDLSATGISAASFNYSGIITTGSDRDVFRLIFAQKSTMHLDALPFGINGSTGSNLDVKIMLYDAAKNLIRTYDPATTMSATIDTVLNQGTYYLVLDGTGNGNASNYGSLGSYTVTGFRSALPIYDVTLSGNVDRNRHQLNWTITADEPVRTVDVETSANGIDFTLLATPSPPSRQASYTSQDVAIRYYRVKATAQSGQTVYSNIIALRSDAAEVKPFLISNLIQQQIRIQSTTPYQYRLMDSQGRLVGSGRGPAGTHYIDMSRQASGFYVIQCMVNNVLLHTERIIKQ